MPFSTSRIGVRSRLRKKLGRILHKSRDSSISSATDEGQHSLALKWVHLDYNSATLAKLMRNTSVDRTASSANSLPLGRPRHSHDSDVIRDDASDPHVNQPLVQPTYPADASTDLWSAAYREAVDSLGTDINRAILKGESVAQLFIQLEEIDKEATEDSGFMKGVRYLHSLQVPLDRFKLALDLVSPLTSIEPTAATVFGVVRSVTAIAITLSTADVDFAKQIGEMLEQISYIDDCDTLGQRSNKLNIHKALVSVYQKLLEFYIAAFDILTRRGTKLIVKMIIETGRLPSIVQDFLKHAENLKRLVQSATWEIVEDIKSMLYDHEISRWLGSGKTRQQGQKHAYLQQLRSDKACSFLLSDTTFTTWYHTQESQELVIFGALGCGKTVTMAFLIDELIKRNKSQLPQPKVCYHYCQDDESGQVAHVLSTLILSLLEQLSGLKKVFFEWYKQANASGNIEPATNPKKLEEFLGKTLETLDRPLFIIIDGLDECDRTSRRILLHALRRLVQKSPRIKIVLSTRPEEEIQEQLEGMPHIDLHSGTERDRFIVDKTVEEQLWYLTQDVGTLVKETLSRLAQGSAIWTKMTVDLIEVRGITAFGPMKTFLDDMPQPGKLSELYAKLLSRYTSDDPENQKLASSALGILAVSRRDLSVLELAWAVALSTAPETMSTVAGLAKLQDYQRVMRLVHPFVASVDFSDLKKRQVRLVHQSVKGFVLDELATSGPRIQDLEPSESAGQTPNQRKALEAGLLDICIRYLLLEEIGDRDLFSEEQTVIQEMPTDVDLFHDHNELADYDPHCTWEAWEENMVRYNPEDRGFGEFFVYASCYWIDHFSTVAPPCLPDLRSIENLCQAGSIRLRNWTAQNSRPECTIQPRFAFESTLYDPLSITSLYGSPAMLHHMTEMSDLGKDCFLPDAVMGAADQIMQWGDLSRVVTLFQSDRVGKQLRNIEFFRLVVKRWSVSDQKDEAWDGIFNLVDDDAMQNSLVGERWGYELFSIAASRTCEPMIQRLVRSAQATAELQAELRRGFLHDPQPASLARVHIGRLHGASSEVGEDDLSRGKFPVYT